MKKYILLLLLMVAMTVPAFSQNANRSGFFIEAAAGVTTGDTPVMGYSVKNNVLSVKCAGGMAANFGFGYRLSTGRHWAYEFRVEGQTSLSKPDLALLGKVFPAGFRYTSSEIFGNSSIYAHINVGGAAGATDGNILDGSYTPELTPDMDMHYAKIFEQGSFGVAYQLGIGLNITTHLYAELMWDSQVMLNTYGKEGKGTIHWGMAGVRVGYRF